MANVLIALCLILLGLNALIHLAMITATERRLEKTIQAGMSTAIALKKLGEVVSDTAKPTKSRK